MYLLSIGNRCKCAIKNKCSAILMFIASICGYLGILSISFVFGDFYWALISLLAAVVSSMVSSNVLKLSEKIIRYNNKCNKNNNPFIDFLYGFVLFGCVQSWLLYQLYLHGEEKKLSAYYYWIGWILICLLEILSSPFIIIHPQFVCYLSVHHEKVQKTDIASYQK